MSDYDDYLANKDAFDMFQRTEDNRRKSAKEKYQESLGPVKNEQQLAQEAFEVNEAIWKRTTRGY
jgi:hypothetical protein